MINLKSRDGYKILGHDASQSVVWWRFDSGFGMAERKNGSHLSYMHNSEKLNRQIRAENPGYMAEGRP